MAPKTKNKARQIALCAILSALGVVFLYVGALIEVLDISAAVLASVGCILAVIEFGGVYPYLVYALTGTLSLIFVPRPEATFMYLLFFGFYPILKLKLERKNKLVSWILKEIIFNISLVAIIFCYKRVFISEVSEPPLIVVATILLCEVTFPVYDLALTKIKLFYVKKIRPKINFK